MASFQQAEKKAREAEKMLMRLAGRLLFFLICAGIVYYAWLPFVSACKELKVWSEAGALDELDYFSPGISNPGCCKIGVSPHHLKIGYYTLCSATKCCYRLQGSYALSLYGRLLVKAIFVLAPSYYLLRTFLVAACVGFSIYRQRRANLSKLNKTTLIQPSDFV